MKELVFWGWLTGLSLIVVGLLVHLVLDIRSDGTGEGPAPAGRLIAILGLGIVIGMLCLPASYEPL